MGKEKDYQSRSRKLSLAFACLYFYCSSPLESPVSRRCRPYILSIVDIHDTQSWLHVRTIWETFKHGAAQAPPLEILILIGQVCGLGGSIFERIPGDSHKQLGLKITDLDSSSEFCSFHHFDTWYLSSDGIHSRLMEGEFFWEIWRLMAYEPLEILFAFVQLMRWQQEVSQPLSSCSLE